LRNICEIYSKPTVQPAVQVGAADPLPAPVAFAFSVKIPVAVALACVVTFSNLTFVAFKDVPTYPEDKSGAACTSNPVPQFLSTTLSKDPFVPTRNFKAWFSPPPLLPISVRFFMFGFEIGVAASLLELLSASIPRLPPFVLIPYQFSPLPIQPSVQSNKSSPTSAAKLVTTKCFASTVPPNHSKPSSDPSSICT